MDGHGRRAASAFCMPRMPHQQRTKHVCVIFSHQPTKKHQAQSRHGRGGSACSSVLLFCATLCLGRYAVSSQESISRQSQPIDMIQSNDVTLGFCILDPWSRAQKLVSYITTQQPETDPGLCNFSNKKCVP